MKRFSSIEWLDNAILYTLELIASVSVLFLAGGLIASVANVLMSGEIIRQDYWLMRGNMRLGVFTPSASLNGVLSSQFAADAAFAPIHPLFEEAYHRMET